MKVVTNPDKELVAEIREKLNENLVKYGQKFCPCVIPAHYNEDTICMCKEFRDQMKREELGECHCGLYVIVED